MEHLLYSLALALVLPAAPARAQTTQMPPGIERVEIINNASVLVARLTFAPGAREPVHTHPFSAVVIQLTEGEVEMTIDTEKSRAVRTPGFAWFIPKDSPHAAVNAGGTPFTVVTVALKSPSGAGAAVTTSSPTPPGIQRTPLLDNTETRVVRVQFGANSREEAHSHPFDLLVIQLTPGRLETLLGSDKTEADLPAGHVQLLPKNVPHAVANVGMSPFEAMSVAIK